jgi:hypothetical protein
LNGDGQRNIEEDLNRDGKVDVLDCRGATGATGATGGTAGFGVIRVSNTSGFDGAEIKQVDVTCPAGKRVVGGGGDVNSSLPRDSKVSLQDTFPLTDNVWRVVAVRNDNCNCAPTPWSVTVWAICIDAR